MEHRTNGNPVTVTRRVAARGQARACVVSLAPVLAVLIGDPTPEELAAQEADAGRANGPTNEARS